MNIQVFPDYDQVRKIAAYIIASQIITKPTTIMGTATGSTALGVYASLVDHYDAGDLDFSKVRIFNLDEYWGFDKDHQQSHYNFIKTNLVDLINMPNESLYVPDGTAVEVFPECKRYEKFIDKCGGIDIQLLGLGRNGHIGFNEPGDHFSPYTYLAELSESTREANAIYFHNLDEEPREAISMGIGTIMRARKIVLVASGYEKATAVREMIAKKITPDCPASILQFHPDVTILIDEAAASML
jgi:glucosamine-6-phosphate deaminase